MLHSILWWAGRAYSVCEPEKFPDGPAEIFTLLVDFLKQYPSGKGMPRVVAHPSTPVTFLCVSAIEAHVRSFSLSKRSESKCILTKSTEVLIGHRCHPGLIQTSVQVGHIESASKICPIHPRINVAAVSIPSGVRILVRIGNFRVILWEIFIPQTIP